MNLPEGWPLYVTGVPRQSCPEIHRIGHRAWIKDRGSRVGQQRLKMAFASAWDPRLGVILSRLIGQCRLTLMLSGSGSQVT